MINNKIDSLGTQKIAEQLEKHDSIVSSLKQLSKGDATSSKEIEKAVSGFEALLLHEMLKGMNETVDCTGLLGENSNQADIYRNMFHQGLADEIAKGRGIGVKDFLRKELTKLTKASNG